MLDLPPPDEPAPPQGRSRHPYFMHDMIRRQSVAAHATCRSTAESLRAQPVEPPGRRLLLVGLGTSFHAALAAEETGRRRFLGRWEVIARTSCDLLESPDLATPETLAVVYSASGETHFTQQAQHLLRQRGARQILITANEEGPSTALADRALVSQYADETSWTHTVSFTTALVSTQVLFHAWGGEAPPEGGWEDEVGESVNQALATENRMIEVADELTPRTEFLFVGSGPCEATAREAALKLREATGRFSAGVGVEELLHGVLPSVSNRTAVVALAHSEFQRARAAQGLRAAREAGAKTLMIDGSGGAPDDGIVSVPPAERPLPAARLVIPLQLLAYWMAVSEGHNPDIMGLDEARILSARRQFGI
jgi:glucosamine--fructose-6-phosphate aminotransferase (isomerizing)